VLIWVTGHCNRAAVSRNRYGVEKTIDTHKIFHTWFCLSYFLKTNIKFYCIYQYFMSINSFFQHRICFSTQPHLQLINLHRNRRYFVIKIHTWFCLSYFLKTNIQFYCICQYLMSTNSFFNTVSVSRLPMRQVT
jgi:hypothetical protein